MIGSYYPALTGCCSLGVRILNHLVRDLRDDFKSTPVYKTVYDKSSFDNWGKAIDVLEKWGIFNEAVCRDFRELETKRNRAIHFQPEVDHSSRDLALEAILLLGAIIDAQFGVFSKQPWMMQGTPTDVYVSGAAETQPFVARVVIPVAMHVGPKHTLSFDDHLPGFVIDEVGDAGAETGTDKEFIALRWNLGSAAGGDD